MKVKYTSKNGRFETHLEGSNSADIFEDVSRFQEVFEQCTCQKCKSDNVRFVVRTNEGNKYYELKCQECHARFSYGVKRDDGNLFPKRKNKDNEWLPDGGWVKWNAATGQEE